MNTYKKIEIGDKYGYWTVKGYAGKRGSKNKDYWNCDCVCGCNRDVLGETLKNGRSSSCGCFQKEVTQKTASEKREVFFSPGDKVGSWVVLGFYGKNPYDETKSANTYLCECDCPWHTRKVLYASHLSNGNTTGCKKCSRFNNLIGKRFGKLLVLELDMDRINNDPKNRIYYICQCNCGSIVIVREEDLLNGYSGSCGCRKESIPERTTRRILKKLGIPFIKQHKFEKCRHINELPFDFYIPSKKICIELDGEDHYRPINRGKWDEDELMERFRDRQLKDSIKTEYCRTHRIKLIRIPYWEFDNIEYILFDKFVKYGLIEEIKSA